MVHSVSSIPAILTQTTAVADMPLPAQKPSELAVPALEDTAAADLLDRRWPQRPESTPGQINSLENTLDDLNASMQAWSTGLRFSIDDEAQRLVVSIVDNASGEVLRTVPSDAVIQVAKMIVQLQGNTVSVKA